MKTYTFYDPTPAGDEERFNDELLAREEAMVAEFGPKCACGIHRDEHDDERDGHEWAEAVRS